MCVCVCIVRFQLFLNFGLFRVFAGCVCVRVQIYFVLSLKHELNINFITANKIYQH